MGVVDEAVEDGVGVGGLADDRVPVGYGELAGDQGGPSAVSIFEDFQQISNPPVRTARSDLPCDAGFGGVAASGYAHEGVFDRLFVDEVGIVVIQPFDGLGVAGMIRIGSGFEHFIEAGNAAAVLGWSIALAADIARVVDRRVAGADIGDDDPMLPVVAEVVDVFDQGFLGFEDVAQPDLGGHLAREGSPVLVHRQAVYLLADGELPQVIVEPADGLLDDVVQNLERD